jgi:nucleotide-binding universal stress UspA family protein
VNDVTCETERTTQVADSIVARADLHRVDFIVVGATGRVRLLDLFRRPVSQLVADMAHCPVLVVRQVRHLWRRQEAFPSQEAA